MEFEFPDTGEGVTEGQFLEWKVDEGDKVEEDQVVGEAETDKAVVDIPAPSDATVRELKVEPGDKVNVGDVIMILDEEGEEKELDSSSETEENKEQNKSKDENEEPNTKDAVMGGSPSASSYDNEKEDSENDKKAINSDILALPKVRKLAEEKEVDISRIDKDGRITEEDVRKFSGSKPEEVDKKDGTGEAEEEEQTEVQDMRDVDARPSVRKLAREHDIEISVLEGSGRNGEVTREDVLEAAGELDGEERKEPVSSESEENKNERPKIEHEGDVERVEMSSVRKITANKMAQSKDEAAHVTHIEKADITKLVELRESVKNDVDAHLTYLPFIMKACIAALKQHPKLNSEFDGEHDEIIQKKFYDFNIAVDTDRGLMVPKIKDVDDKNMVELAEQIGDKASRAQNAELDREELKPGTFSITNLGVIGGEAFTPIIYPPQSAILGVGKIQDTAEVVDGEVVPRKTVKLSLSYDHRVVDGAEAARFMSKVVEDLENPKNLIIDM